MNDAAKVFEYGNTLVLIAPVALIRCTKIQISRFADPDRPRTRRETGQSLAKILISRIGFLG